MLNKYGCIYYQWDKGIFFIWKVKFDMKNFLNKIECGNEYVSIRKIGEKLWLNWSVLINRLCCYCCIGSVMNSVENF